MCESGCLTMRWSCLRRFLPRRWIRPETSVNPEPEESFVQHVKVLFFSGEEAATVGVRPDWRAAELKRALRPFLGKGTAVSGLIHGGDLLADEDLVAPRLADEPHLHVTVRKCCFLVECAGAEVVNGFYVRKEGELCDAPVYVNEAGILLFKYQMARGTTYWYFSRDGDLNKSDGDFYRAKSSESLPPSEGWNFEACPLGRNTRVPSLTFCGHLEEDQESTDVSSSEQEGAETS
ncbi:unnamed protein product [Effrenium voratum]|nr:unnamed protein product [Effrenium voratum]